jgi:hypothetical protein
MTNVRHVNFALRTAWVHIKTGSPQSHFVQFVSLFGALLLALITIVFGPFAGHFKNVPFSFWLPILITAWNAWDELQSFRNHPGRPKLVGAPGQRLNKLASFLYSKGKYDKVFAPTIGDMRQEYFEALSEGKTRKARWVWARGILSVLAAVVADVPLSLIGLVRKIWTTVQ